MQDPVRQLQQRICSSCTSWYCSLRLGAEQEVQRRWKGLFQKESPSANHRIRLLSLLVVSTRKGALPAVLPRLLDRGGHVARVFRTGAARASSPKSPSSPKRAASISLINDSSNAMARSTRSRLSSAGQGLDCSDHYLRSDGRFECNPGTQLQFRSTEWS